MNLNDIHLFQNNLLPEITNNSERWHIALNGDNPVDINSNFTSVDAELMAATLDNSTEEEISAFNLDSELTGGRVLVLLKGKPGKRKGSPIRN